MNEKLVFTAKDPIREARKKYNAVFNFENLHSLWLFKNEKVFRKEILKSNNLNFPDGRVLSIFLRIRQQRGPTFSRDFLTSDFAKDKRHFFIGSATTRELSEKIGIKENNLQVYNPPFLKNLEFSKKEKEKMISKLKKFKPDYVWVCIGNPKQEILANQLFEKYKTKYFSVGAALDFLLEKKKEAPKFWRFFAMEWVYRLITDFKHSKKKVWRHLVAMAYLNLVRGEK